MLRLTNLSVPLDYTDDSLRLILLKKLKLSPDQLLSFHVSRRSIDARNKQDVHFVLSVDLALKDERTALKHSKNLSPIHNPDKGIHSSSFIVHSSLSLHRRVFRCRILRKGGAQRLLTT